MRAAPRPGAWEPVHSSVGSEARQWQLKRELEQARGLVRRLDEKSRQMEHALADAVREETSALPLTGGAEVLNAPAPFGHSFSDLPGSWAVSSAALAAPAAAWVAPEEPPPAYHEAPRRRQPRQLAPVVDSVSYESSVPHIESESFASLGRRLGGGVSTAWDGGISTAWDEREASLTGEIAMLEGELSEFVDLETLSESVLEAKRQQRRRLRRQQKREKLRLVARSLRRLRLRQTFGGWVALRSAGQGRALRHTRARSIIGRLRFRLAQRAAAAAFAAWTELHRRCRIIARTLGRLRNMQLAASWRAWTQSVEDAKHKRAVLARAVGKLQRGLLAKCYETWAAVVDHKQRMQAAARRVAARLLNAKLAAAFGRWLEFTAQVTGARAVLRKVTAKLANLALSRSWGGWHESVQAAIHQRRVCGQAVRRLANLAIGGAFSGWRTWVEAKQTQARVLRKAVGRMSSAALSVSFQTWGAAVAAAAASNNAAEQMMRQWANRSLVEALRRWTDVTRERSRVRHEMRKVALRWNQRQLSAAWHHWLAIREDTAGKLLAQEKAIALLTGRRGLEACREVLVRWSEHAALTARLRRLLSRRLDDNMERWLRAAMLRWRERALDNRCASKPPVLRFFSSDWLKCLWLLLCPFGVLASARVALAALWRSAPHSYRHPLLRSAATDPMSVHSHPHKKSRLLRLL